MPATRSCSAPACDSTEIEDVIAGNASGIGDHGADIARLAVLSAGWPFATPGPDDQPLLRLRPAGRRDGRHRRAVGPPGPRHRRRRRVDEPPVPPRLRRRARDDGRRQPARAPEVPADPAGHLGRPHRHRRGLLPRPTATSSPCPRRSAPPRRSPRAASTSSVIPVHNEDGSVALDHEEFPRPGTTLESLVHAGPELRRDGRHAVGQVRRRDVRRDVHAHVPADRQGRPRPPRRQLVRRRRRRLGDPRRLVGLRPGQRPQAAGPHPHDGRRRLGAGDHAHRPGPRRPAGAAEGRHDGRRHRPLGDQRGVRRRRAEGDPRARPRHRQAQRQRRRDGPRPPDRRHRPDAHPDGPRRARAHRQGGRPDRHVHRRRHGHRHHHRAASDARFCPVSLRPRSASTDMVDATVSRHFSRRAEPFIARGRRPRRAAARGRRGRRPARPAACPFDGPRRQPSAIASPSRSTR